MAHQFHRIFITMLLFPYSFSELSEITNKDIIKFLQSSRFDTTNVFIIVDNNDFFKSENAYDILKLFSERKTCYLITLPQLELDEFMLNANAIEKLKLSKEEHFENSNKISNESAAAELMNRLNVDKSEKFRRSDFFEWTNFKLIKNNLSDTTSMVYIIRNLTVLKRILEQFEKNPSLIKFVYVYDECQENVRFIKQPISEFLTNLWIKYRSMYTYFIVDCLEANETVNSTFLYDKINIVIMFAKFINSRYFYDPFSKESNESKGSAVYGQLKEIDLSGDTQGYNFLKKKLHLNGFTLKISFFRNSAAILKTDVPYLARDLTPEILAKKFTSIEAFFGMEVDILLELATLMDFKYEIGPPTDNVLYGLKTENGTFNGGLGDILYRRVEFGLNGYFTKDYETADLEFTLAIHDDKLCVVVQSPPLLANSKLLLKVFSPEVWLLLFGTFIAASILYSYLLHYVNLLKYLKFPYWFKKSIQFKSANIIYNKFSATVSQSTRIMAVILNTPLAYGFDSSSYERVFVSLFLFLGINIIGLFQSSLVDCYTTPRAYPSINTLIALDDSGIPIYVKNQGLIADVFGANPKGKPLESLRQKLVPTKDDSLNYNIATQGNMAGLARLADYTRISVSVPHRQDGVSLLHIVPDCPKSYTIGYMFPKSSIYLETVNHYLLLLASNGLARKWERDMIYVFKLEIDRRNRQLDEESVIVLTISHLQPAFIMLSVGCMSSLFVFIIELFWERLRVKKMNFEKSNFIL